MKQYEITIGCDYKFIVEVDSDKLKIIKMVNGWGDAVDVGDIGVEEY